jgi:serine/threonine protein kinase
MMAERIEKMYDASLEPVPGTSVYMPPEAFGENPHYTEKLDCFSFGVLAVQVMTLLYPVTEAERHHHIGKIDTMNPLLDVAIECLVHKMEERPHAQELCRRIEFLMNVIIPHSIALCP